MSVTAAIASVAYTSAEESANFGIGTWKHAGHLSIWLGIGDSGPAQVVDGLESSDGD